MMRRIDLLPAVYQARRQQRRTIALVVVAGLLLLAGVLAYWLALGVRNQEARNELAQVTERNEGLQAEVDSLQRFAALEEEVNAKQAALATVMTGDVEWTAVLTEVATLVPEEIWLTSLTASAGQTEGAAAVGTETAAVRIVDAQPFGRIQFQGSSLSMSGVGRWLERMAAAEEFRALWLNSATESEIEEGTEVVNFDSTLEMSEEAASRRYQEGEAP